MKMAKTSNTVRAHRGEPCPAHPRQARVRHPVRSPRGAPAQGPEYPVKYDPEPRLRMWSSNDPVTLLGAASVNSGLREGTTCGAETGDESDAGAVCHVS